MAKKTLNEAVVRRFQKLANVGALNEMYGMREEEEEEVDAMADDAMDVAADAGEEMADADADAEMDPAMDIDLTDEEANVLIELGQKLEAAMGGNEEEEGEEEAGEEMADADAADGDMADEEAIMEALRGISYKPSKNEVVNEVAKRVAKRLKTAKLHEAKLNRALGRK